METATPAEGMYACVCKSGTFWDGSSGRMHQGNASQEEDSFFVNLT